MSRILMFAMAAGLSMPVAPQQTEPVLTDTDFIMKAAEAGMKGVEVGKLAADKASNPDVKAFGLRLLVDHSIVNGELLKLSKSRNVALTVSLKTDPTAPILKTGESNANLMTLDGVAFDRAFIDQMVKEHEEAVELFHAEADGGRDTEVKEWAEKKLPTLKDRLKLAKDLQERIAR